MMSWRFAHKDGVGVSSPVVLPEVDDRYSPGAVGGDSSAWILERAHSGAGLCEAVSQQTGRKSWFSAIAWGQLVDMWRASSETLDLPEVDADASMHEKYLGDGMYQLTYVVAGRSFACETSATTVGKVSLADWITEHSGSACAMFDATPKRWLVAPGDGTKENTPAHCGPTCCGAPMAWDCYRGEYRCTKCGFDEV